MPVNPLGYPLDLQGNNPANFIVNEIRTFNTVAQRLFVPSAGPFYRIDFEIRNNVTNQLLLPNTDYKIVHLHKAAVLISGKNVNAGIYVHNTNIPSVRVSYRVIGGHFADTADVIRQLFLDNPPMDAATIPWDHVFGAPAQMPPVEHLHDMLDTYGYGNLITVLEQLRVAVIAGDGPAIDAIYRYIEILLTNSGFVTAQEVLNMINLDTANQVKVYATYADLRAETELPNNSDLLYITLGKNTRYDGRGRQFVWSIASTDVDDNDKVVKPTIILTNGNGPGRLLSVLNVERDLKNSLDTLGRKVDNDGVVLTDLAATFPLTVDLDTVITAGTYWVAPTATNKPVGTTKAHLSVEVSETFVTQTLISIVQDVSENAVVTAVTTARVFTRNGYLSSGNYIWEDWLGLIDRNTINTALKTLGRRIDDDYSVYARIAGLNHTNGADLNAVTTPGTHWVDNTCTNRPPNVDNGMLYVESADGNYIFQRMQGGQNATPFADNTAARTDYTEHVRIGIRALPADPFVWSTWESMLTRTRATVNGIDVHLAETNIAGADLNTHGKTGVHWVNNTQLNRAFDWGILEVIALNATDSIQVMHNTGNRAARYGYGGTDYAGHSWHPWIYSQQANLQDTSDFNATAQSLNLCVKVGRHWFGIANTEKPFDYGMVEVIQLNDAEILQIAHSTLDRGNATRTWLDGTGWTPWAYPLDTRVSLRNGIETNLSLTNSLPYGGGGLDLDSYIGPAKYWVGDPGVINCPSEMIGSILEVEQIAVGQCLQTLRTNGQEAKRQRYYVSPGVYAWTPWLFRANRNGQSDQSFAMFSYPINLIDPSHGVNAAFLATQMATLWTRLTANGIDAAVSVTNDVPHYNDLDDLIVVGKYWIGNTIQNAPFSWAVVEVEMVEASNIIQTVYDGYRKTTRRTTSGGATWTDWHYSIHLNIAEESSKDNMDLDWALTPGEYYYTPNTISRPSPYGLVKVWRETNDIVYQQAQSAADNFLYTRYRASNGTWTPWLKMAASGEVILASMPPGFFVFHTDTSITFTLKAGRTARVMLMAGGGGGGSCSEEGAVVSSPTGGGATVLQQQSGAVVVARAEGGGYGYDSARWGVNSYSGPSGTAAAANPQFPTDYLKHLIVVHDKGGNNGMANGAVGHQQAYNAYVGRGTGGLGWQGYTNVPTAGNGAGGAYIELTLNNPSFADIVYEVFVGDGGTPGSSYWGSGSAGTDGWATVILGL